MREKHERISCGARQWAAKAGFAFVHESAGYQVEYEGSSTTS